MLWAPYDGDAFAGRGAACLSVGASLASLVNEAERVFAGLRVIAHPDRADYAPRLFGGQTFDPTRPAWRDPAWEPFFAAAFPIPRWALSERDGRRTLAVTVLPTRCADAASMHDEILSVLRAL